MNKTLLILTAAAVVAAVPVVQAEEAYDYKPYIGFDYAYTNGVTKHMRPNYNSGSVNVGTDYNRFFSTEVFYQYSDKSSKGHNSDRVKTSFQAAGLDLYGYLPLTCYRDLALIGTAGIGMYDFKTSLGNPALKGGHDHGYGYRAGAGILYTVDDHWSVRAVARYVGLDQIEDYDHMMEYSAGIRYNF